MNDLLALATIRRVLLECGHHVIREPAGALAGPLEIWMHMPQAELGGVSPFRALQLEDGEARVRACLARIVELSHGTERGGPTASDIG